MKKTILSAAIVLNVFISCMAQDGKKPVRMTYTNNRNQTTITVNDGTGKLKIEMGGDIKFTDDEQSIQSISRDGYLRYKKNGKRLSAVSDGNGGISYEVYEGDTKLVMDEKGKQLLAEVIRTLIENGVDLKGHVDRVYKKGGADAVVKDIKKFGSDYYKSNGLGYLVKEYKLNAAESAMVLDEASAIGSDFEKANLLKSFPADILKDDKVGEAYLKTVKSISSDFEKANTVKEILNQPLSDENFFRVLNVVNSISSDFEKANVLKDVLESNKISDNRFDAVLSSAKKISSDFEKAGILKQIAGDKKLSDENWVNLMLATKSVSSDFEKSNVLIEIADNMPKNENLKTVFMEVAKTISSDFEYGRVVRKVK